MSNPIEIANLLVKTRDDWKDSWVGDILSIWYHPSEKKYVLSGEAPPRRICDKRSESEIFQFIENSGLYIVEEVEYC